MEVLSPHTDPLFSADSAEWYRGAGLVSRAPHYRTRQTTRRQERQGRPYPPAASQMGAAIARGMKQVKSADGNGNFEQVNITRSRKRLLFCTNSPLFSAAQEAGVGLGAR